MASLWCSTAISIGMVSFLSRNHEHLTLGPPSPAVKDLRASWTIAEGLLPQRHLETRLRLDPGDRTQPLYSTDELPFRDVE
jgi:hypothetical protein